MKHYSEFYLTKEIADEIAPFFGGEVVRFDHTYHIKVPTSYGPVTVYFYPLHDELSIDQLEKDRSYELGYLEEKPWFRVWDSGSFNSLFQQRYYKEERFPNMAKEWAQIMYSGCLGMGKTEIAAKIAKEFNLSTELLETK